MGCFGITGTGKSEYALNYILDIQSKEAVYVIAHDLNYSIPERLHNGRKTNVKRYQTIEEAEEGLLKSPGGIHAIACSDASDVIALGIRTADRSLERNTVGGRDVIRRGGGRGIPVIVYIDEIVNAQQASQYRMGDDLKKFVGQRRHLHCGLVYTSQYPRQCHYSLGEQATDVVFFKLKSEKDIKKLYESFGVPEDQAWKAQSLSGHQFIHCKTGA